MIRYIVNRINMRKLRKLSDQQRQYDIAAEYKKLIDAGISEYAALAIINAIWNAIKSEVRD